MKRSKPIAGLACLLAAFIAGSGQVSAQTNSANQGGSADYLLLTREGHANAAIMVGAGSGPSDRFVARELQRYIEKVSRAELPIVTDERLPAGTPLVIVGGPKGNSLSAMAQQRQLAKFDGLKSEGFVLKTIELDGRRGVVVGGNDETGTMYAAYELLERLGIVFQLSGDIIPEQKSDLGLPALDLRMEAMAKFRGLLVEHAYGEWNMGLRDYRRLIDQMAKLKLDTLQFTFHLGSPFLRFTYEGKVGEIINTPESHYLAWGRDSRSWGKSPHASTGSVKDVRVGKEVFPNEYVGAPEFADVRTPEEAFNTARQFLHDLISYAHRRHVQVSLIPVELAFVPPNLANYPPDIRANDDDSSYDAKVPQRYCGVAMSPGDPVTLDIWDAAMEILIETYPEADSYGFWTTEYAIDSSDPRIRKILRQYAGLRGKLPSVEEIHRRGNLAVGSAADLDGDFLQMYLSAQVIQRIKGRHPNVKLAVVTLFKGYMLPVLDSMLPKDVALGNMEDTGNTRSVMDFYGGITGRDLFTIPRITDDGDEMHMQLNAAEYDQDEIISGAAKYGLGIVGQFIHPRNAEYDVRYLAEGAWDPKIRQRPFYESYLSRLYGRDALEPLLHAFLLLEENEQSMVYAGRSEIFMAFQDFSSIEGLGTGNRDLFEPFKDLSYLKQLETNGKFQPTAATENVPWSEPVYNTAPERVAMAKPNREILLRAIHATWGMGSFWDGREAYEPPHAADAALTEGQNNEKRAAQCRQALALLLQARDKVLPGSRSELEYVIYKTEGLIDYFDVLTACYEARIALDRAWLGMIDGDRFEFGMRLDQCRAVLDLADRLAREAAGRMIAYADDPTERYLLLRYNRNVIASIENGRKNVAEVIALLPGVGTATPGMPADKTKIGAACEELLPEPTLANVRYGLKERQKLDFWRAKSSRPTPLVFIIHGGAWIRGDKAEVDTLGGLESYLEAGISVVSVDYRFLQNAYAAGVNPPVQWPLRDAARALQFVRSKASEWNLDGRHIAVSGDSAGACSCLWLAFHKDLAEAASNDPVARESTRPFCAAVEGAQTTLDPAEMKEWTPNSSYGNLAFGIFKEPMPREQASYETFLKLMNHHANGDFEAFLARRGQILPLIQEYSPYGLVAAGDPPIYLHYVAPPALGQNQKDPTHTSNFGVKLQEKLRSVGVECELVYPGARNVRHAKISDYLIEKLAPPNGERLATK